MKVTHTVTPKGPFQFVMKLMYVFRTVVQGNGLRISAERLYLYEVISFALYS